MTRDGYDAEFDCGVEVGDADVAVVGFGTVGATAALAAAQAGARVVAVYPSVPDGQVQRSACDAGVAVRLGSAHEILIEAGRIVGLGYATGDEWAGEEHGWGVGQVSCSSVILAVSSRHWDFVGSAVWSVIRAFTRNRVAAGVPAQRPAVEAESGRGAVLAGRFAQVPDEPELAVRRWCAHRDRGAAVAEAQLPLRIDERTSLLVTGAGDPVPGLYVAVPPQPGEPGHDPANRFTAARRAGAAAAHRVLARSPLRSVG